MKPHILIVSAAAALGSVGAGCAAPKAAISAELIARLPYDGRAAIYDRENDVTIARDRRDDARLQVERLDNEIDELSARWNRTEQRLNKIGGGARIGACRYMFEAKKSYLKAELKYAEADVDYEDEEVKAALARLEKARSAQLVRYGLAPESKMAPFDQAERVANDKAKAAEKRKSDLRVEQQKAFDAWKAAEDSFFATGDFDAGIWID
jgi:hypothetical protein